MGQAAGMVTGVVLTGVTRREDIARLETPPDYILKNLGELPGLIE
jgi:ribonucleotide monophosphatase NagD (HAD superfamily)